MKCGSGAQSVGEKCGGFDAFWIKKCTSCRLQLGVRFQPGRDARVFRYIRRLYS